MVKRGTTVYLLRHGLAAAGLDDLDPGLAPLGHEQAAATAVWFRGVCTGQLVVSPLRRTRETAAPIATELSLAAEIRREVSEVFDPSLPVSERQASIGPLMAGRWSGQSDALRAWRDRVVMTVLDLGTGDSPGVVIVSHYVAIGAVIGHALGDDRVRPVAIPNASITTVQVEGRRISLLESPSVAHLAAEQVTGAGGGEALAGTGEGQ
jgi:broad specificity phosphatase PhoE